MLRRLRIALIFTVSTLLVLAALCVGLFRLAVELLPGYKAEIVASVEQAIGRPVALDHIDLRWRGLGPEIVINRLRLLNEDGSDSALELAQASARFSFIDLLRGNSVVRPRAVSVDGLTLAVVREADGRIRVQNLDGGGGSFDGQQLLQWLFKKGRVEASNVRINWLDMQRPPGATDSPQFYVDTARLEGNGSRQRLQADVTLPAELGDSLDLDIILSGDPQNWVSEFTVNADSLQIAAFPQQWLRNGGEVIDGRASTELSGTVANGRLVEANGSWEVLDAKWQSAYQSPVKSWPALSGKLQWQDNQTAWKLTLTELQSRGEGVGTVQLELNRESVPQQLYASADRLPLADLAAAIVILPNVDDRIIGWLDSARPTGTGYELTARLALDGSNIVGGSARLQVEQLQWQAAKPVPGMAGISGDLHWNGKAVSLLLTEDAPGKDVTFEAPWIFRTPIVMQQADAQITLENAADALTIRVDDIALGNANLGLNGSASLRLQPNSAANLWLNLGVPYANIPALSEYLPVGAMRPQSNLVRWLDNAFEDGQVNNGSIHFDGPLVRDALSSGVGNFRATLNVANTQLQFQPAWPVVENIQAKVNFSNAGVEVNAETASLLGLELQNLQASIPDLFNAEVVVSGNFDTSVEEAFRFLRQTPLKRRFGKILAGFDTTGRAVGRLERFSLPLKKPYIAKLNGYLDIRDGRLRGPDWPQAITDISGRLSFSERTLKGSRLKGEALGVSATGSLATKAKGVVLTLSGNLSDSWLSQRLAVPPEWLQGSAAWRGEVELGNGAPRWQVNSDLRGLAINFPAPLGKEAGAERALEVRSGAPANSALVVAVAYDRWLNAQLRWYQATEKMIFDAAHVELGGGQAQLAAGDEGVRVSGALADVNATPWLGLLTAAPSGSGSDGLDLRQVNLRFNQLRLGDLYFPQQALQWTPRQQGGWQLDAIGEGLAGRISWFNKDSVSADIQRLHIRQLNRSTTVANPGQAIPPKNLPTVRFSCAQCRFNDLALGTVNFQLNPLDNGLDISQLEINSPTLQLTGSVRWQNSLYGPQTTIRATATTENLNELLAGFGYVDALEAERAVARGRVNWPGGPGSMKFSTVEGEVSLEAKDGRIFKVDSGAAKAIGLFSLDMLPKRLSMNFDDVVKPGFAFDKISGDFMVSDGDAITDNLKIEGPSATIQVTGRTGLASRDYDQKIQVNPKLGGGLTIAGAVLGGTGVGAALLVGQELLSQPMQSLTGLRYSVTGSWDKPIIESPKLDPSDVKTGPRGRRR